MAAELGIEPSYTTIFERTFQKRDKTWTGKRAKTIKEKYDELLMAGSSSDDGVASSELSADNMALWVEAAGGIKNGRIFGMGSLLRLYTQAGTNSSINAAASRRSRLENQMTDELSQLKNLLVKKDREIRAVKEQYEILKSKKDEEIKAINEQFETHKSQTDGEIKAINEQFMSL